jgi:hypothetical protein
VKDSKFSGQINFMPDPVCARLAMCLMDENWEVASKSKRLTIHGNTKKWWIDRVKEVYLQGLCTPEKGDPGEVMVALYFLFCADLLRQQDAKYETFSVPLSDWVDSLVNGGMKKEVEEAPPARAVGRKKGAEGEPPAKKMKTEQFETQVNKGKSIIISFDAIQVCRNYLRAYDKSWNSLFDKKFLENMYMSGIGFYVFAGCPMIDLVFSLRIEERKDQTVSYLPMFVSVKAHVRLSPKTARGLCDNMVAQANRVEGSGSALCLLVLLGLDGTEADDGALKLSQASVKALHKKDKKVAAVLRVPFNDKFGLSKMFRDITSTKRERSELFASHSFVSAHCGEEDWKSTDFAKEVLRCRPKKDLNDYAKGMYEALQNIKPDDDGSKQLENKEDDTNS